MGSWLRKIAFRLPYPLLLRLLVLHRELFALPRERRLVRNAGVATLDRVYLEAYKQSDTLFVLGSGSSINQISAERWSGIAAHDTLGFNFWLYHPFVPRFYFFENVGAAAAVFEPLKQAIASRAADYADVPKIMMDFDRKGRSLISELPPA